MKRTWTFEHSSEIPAPSQAVWDRVVTPEGINDEMRPWMTMSIPRGPDDLTIDTLELGRPIGRAWVKLFGVLPYDFDHLSIVELDPGRYFREESTMMSMRRWTHQRTVEPVGLDRTRITDRITFSPRLGMAPSGPIIAKVLTAFFRHRHRRLAAHFA
ncbi:SRPBCC family protein [Mycolicibacterium brumae]|uniref:SRPBCC family protein n=1 Tax=Mycolicibacterium brumae TaxID=85968 RepID=A0A2G5PDG6_9MYCO|nr:SRPBCC family protein [Mycolicibacterium brumae]MCV7191741.1 SRPBCC family protein [Mycolicibacterium brumae]PIB76368.1 hypothetical protein CQY22_006575 [Mycolicibacterium brumae]RWA15885.1 hypothetical protein MBRU_10060 [Mycolicibacterium brumae DSM 44177]UWW07046.1 SRPBCC family protein [Mycolicibacterium brumae]